MNMTESEIAYYLFCIQEDARLAERERRKAERKARRRKR